MSGSAGAAAGAAGAMPTEVEEADVDSNDSIDRDPELRPRRKHDRRAATTLFDLAMALATMNSSSGAGSIACMKGNEIMRFGKVAAGG